MTLQIGIQRDKKLSVSDPDPNGKRHSKAFTLVELLIAVAVIAVGMVFILGALSQCVSAFTTAQNMVTANYLLNKKIWEIKKKTIFVSPMTSSSISLEGFYVNASGFLVTVLIIGYYLFNQTKT